MSMFVVIIMALFIAVALYLYIEYRVHTHNLNSIPIRIHVNGTRGKSSVTRLIAGALRENGLKVYAKTTGTLPRMIMENGSEYPIYRPGGANIIEQLRIVSLAANNRADVMVIECMAVHPYLQSITELKFIKATHGVITNARADHLDVMGPTEKDVALALLGTVPREGKLFTAEMDYIEEFKKTCKDRKSELFAVTQLEIESITDEDMAGFNYVEHKENVALILKVCDSLNVPRDVAYRGMWNSQQDPGALSEHEIQFFGRKIMFVNGFAANDPESSERIWRLALETHREFDRKIMIISTRADRPDRSKQLVEAFVKWPPADRYVLMGSGVYLLFRKAVANRVDPSRVVYAEGLPANEIFEEIIAISGQSALVMGIGNIVGPGMELVKYFRNRALKE